jgi:hypothetical protein
MLSNEYVIGLVDGEGSFYVRLNSDIKRRNKVELKFSLKLIPHMLSGFTRFNYIRFPKEV